MSGFIDYDKVNGVLNTEFLLTITVTVIDNTVARFLVNGGSLCNVFYDDTLE